MKTAELGEVQLGDVVKDSITGFAGVAVAITEWIHACRRITVQPKALEAKKGTPVETYSFDEPQLYILTKKTAPKVSKPKRKKTGGPAREIRGLMRPEIRR